VIGSYGRRVLDLKSLCFSVALGALSPALLGPTLLAQDKLQRELEFVRGLAREMRFVELARTEAERLATEFRDAADQDRIAQLAVEITYTGARSKSDRVQQRALFKETVEQSKRLIEMSKDDKVQLAARITLAEASADYGKFLIEELEIARNEDPERLKELEVEAMKVFEAGIDTCKSLRDSLAGNDEMLGRRNQMWLQIGVLTREQARADKKNRSVLVERAIRELEELVFEAGEETYVGMRAMFEIAQCREVDGKVAEAIMGYQSTIRSIALSLEASAKGELELDPGLEYAMFTMLQEVYVRTGEVMLAQGSPETADLFAQFRKHMADFGQKGADLFDAVDEEFGHQMLLAEAKFFAETGEAQKIADAMAMVKRINDKHPNDFVGVRAKAVLRDILAVHKNLANGALLFEIAKGEFQNKNLEVPISGLRRTIPLLTPEDQKVLALESWQLLGTSYGLSERYLEAILAFKEGLQRHGGDDEKRASDTADALDRAISALKRQTKNATEFDGLYSEAAELIKTYSVGGGAKLFWKQGNDLFQDKKYAEAIAQFQQVDEKFLWYERARVNIGRCHALLGDLTAARGAFDQYKAWTKEHEIDARDTARQQARVVALLETEFTEMQMAYLEARGSTEPKIEKDLAKYPAATSLTEAFVANHEKDGGNFVPIALDYLGRLYADQAMLDKAEAVRVRVKAIDPARASRLAIDLFREYQGQIKTLGEELDKLIAAGKDEKTIEKATADLEAVQTSLVALGLDYIAGAPKPQLGVLVATAQNCEQLRQWERVSEVAKKTLDLYESDPADTTKRVLDQVIRPMVGEALLQLRKFDEALTMLQAAETANPLRIDLKRQIARALGGWFEIDRTGRAQRVPGLDRPVDAYNKYMQDFYNPKSKSPDLRKFSIEWYRMQWEAYWFAKQAGTKDEKFKGFANSIYGTTRSTDDFATLKTLGAEGLRLHKYFMNNRN